MYRLLGLGGSKGKDVTCNGFWVWEGEKEKVSQLTVSVGLEGEGKRCHR
jgi:hypothetical protein